VAAILAGDPDGLADTYDAYGSALFAFCLSMLHDRSSAEDAVQDSFVILAQRVGQLRDPERLRPWLYAVARTQCLRQLRAARRNVPVEELDEAMSAESVDFDAGVHSAQLQTLVWEAMAGLNPGERAALELSLRHGLDGDDLAASLGVTRRHASKLMERGRAELERGLGALLVARNNDGRCAELAAIVDGWDGTLTVLMRKRLGRHIDGCAECGAQKRHRVSASALLAAIPLLAAPAALRQAVLDRHRMRLVSDEIDLDTHHAERRIVRSIGWFDAAGFPDERTPKHRAVGALVAAACAVLLLITMVALGPGPRRRASLLGAGQPAVTGAPSPTLAAPTSTKPSTPASTPAKHVVTTPPTSHTPSTTASGTPAPSSPTSIPSTTTPPAPKPSAPAHPKTTTPPAPPTVQATFSPTKYPAAQGGSGLLKISVSGGAITWSATATGGITVSPAGGTVAANGTVHAKVVVPAAKPGAIATVTVTWPTGSKQFTVTWS
jgi:RNA polymerase sigma factor (sigma-70 family)